MYVALHELHELAGRLPEFQDGDLWLHFEGTSSYSSKSQMVSGLVLLGGQADCAPRSPPAHCPARSPIHRARWSWARR